jgi:hypothetical protein
MGGKTNILSEKILFSAPQNFKLLGQIKVSSINNVSKFIISVRGGRCDYSPGGEET